jgi:hypothetical protein
MSANIIRLLPDEERALLVLCGRIAARQLRRPLVTMRAARFWTGPVGFNFLRRFGRRASRTPPHRLAHIVPRGTLSIFQGFFDAAQVLPPADSESHQYPI